MCRRVDCPKCGRPTYAGCGAHIEQVLGDVPPAARCRCRERGRPRGKETRTPTRPRPPSARGCARCSAGRTSAASRAATGLFVATSALRLIARHATCGPQARDAHATESPPRARPSRPGADLSGRVHVAEIPGPRALRRAAASSRFATIWTPSRARSPSFRWPTASGCGSASARCRPCCGSIPRTRASSVCAAWARPPGWRWRSGSCPRLAAAVAWAAYLSFVSAGRVFMRFQWDTLLLEAGLHALFGRPRRWLMRTLALRLQLESGIAKLASHDPTWRDLTACCHHNETQPLPTPLGWYAHHLPRRVLRFGTALALLVECGVPAFLFGPRRVRQAARRAPDRVPGAHRRDRQLRLLQRADGGAEPQRARAPARPTRRRAPGRRRARSRARSRARRRPLGPRSRRARLHAAAPGAGRFGLVERLATVTAPLHAREHLRPVLDDDDDAARDRRRGLRRRRSVGGVCVSLQARRPDAAAAAGWRRTSRASTGRCGSPPSARRRAWFATFLARLLEGAPDVLALLDGNPFPAGRPASSARGSTTTR